MLEGRREASDERDEPKKKRDTHRVPPSLAAKSAAVAAFV
jgi:hypothetical protein